MMIHRSLGRVGKIKEGIDGEASSSQSGSHSFQII